MENSISCKGQSPVLAPPIDSNEPWRSQIHETEFIPISGTAGWHLSLRSRQIAGWTFIKKLNTMTLNMIWISKFCGGYVGIFIAAFGDKLLNTKSSLIIPCSYLIGPFENVISAIDQTLCVRPDLRVQSANNPRLRNLLPTMLLQFIRAKQIILYWQGLKVSAQHFTTILFQ